MRLLKGMSLKEFVSHLYPKLIPIHLLTEDQGIIPESGSKMKLPKAIRLSYSWIENSGMYLLGKK